jgi:hypothetical protein
MYNELHGKSPSWEADSNLLDQEISRVLWNAKFLYGVPQSPPLEHILGQMNPINALTHHLTNHRFRFLFPSQVTL